MRLEAAQGVCFLTDRKAEGEISTGKEHLLLSAWSFCLQIWTLCYFHPCSIEIWGRGYSGSSIYIQAHTGALRMSSYGDSLNPQGNLLSTSLIPNALFFHFSVLKLDNSIFCITKMRVKSLWFMPSVLSFTDSTITETFDYPFCFQARLKVLWILTAMQQQWAQESCKNESCVL